MEKIRQSYQAFLFVEWLPDTPQVKKEKKEHMVQLHTAFATRYAAFNPKGKKQPVSYWLNQSYLREKSYKEGM